MKRADFSMCRPTLLCRGPPRHRNGFKLNRNKSNYTAALHELNHIYRLSSVLACCLTFTHGLPEELHNMDSAIITELP